MPAYESARHDDRHPVADGWWWAAGIAAAAGAWLQPGWPLATVVAVLGAVIRPRWALPLCLIAALAAVAGFRAEQSWAAVRAPVVGEFNGWARIVDDPTSAGSGTRTVLEVDGQRFAVLAFGSAGRRLAARHAGQWVDVAGTRRAADLRTWQRARHIVGRFDVRSVSATWEGRPLDRAANRLRGAFRDAAHRAMPDQTAEVFLGLIIGDDGRQAPATVAAFRASGLSHLSAVSGQNVAYTVAMASLVLRWMRPLARWVATVAVIGWFVLLTRAEPSVLRAGTMAILATAAFAVGRTLPPARVLGATVSILVLLDPLLVWSVGFWLSVLATTGVMVLAPWLDGQLPGPAWIRVPMAVSLGAQLAVAVPSLLVFGRLPFSGLWANLLAVPVAGLVMFAGIPCALAAALVPAFAGPVLFPVALGTHWVLTVARLGQRLEPPPGPWSWTAWVVLVGSCVWLARRCRVRH